MADLTITFQKENPVESLAHNGVQYLTLGNEELILDLDRRNKNTQKSDGAITGGR